MKKIIFATKNKGKMKEIKSIMQDLDYEVISMEEAGITVDVVEDGETFEENALKKAIEIMKCAKEIVLADDSGIEIDFLNKQPGVYSARYLGENTPYEVKNQKILELLKDVKEEKRTARFVCVIAVAFPNGEVKPFTQRAEIEGMISYEAKGTNGFGYDPIFFVPTYQMTTAEMTNELKNKISHRGKALELMKVKLLEIGV